MKARNSWFLIHSIVHTATAQLPSADASFAGCKNRAARECPSQRRTTISEFPIRPSSRRADPLTDAAQAGIPRSVGVERVGDTGSSIP